MKKRMLALLMCGALAASMFTGCGSKEEPATDSNVKTEETEAVAEPETQTGEEVAQSDNPLANTYYDYYFDNDGMAIGFYFHFYNEVPGLGNVYYAGYVFNQMTEAGTYEITEEPYDYSVYESRESEAPIEGTAPYTIVLYDFNGNETGRLGYDGESQIYNELESVMGYGGAPQLYTLDTEPETSAMADQYAGEVGIKYLGYVATDDNTCTVDLYHNGTYSDMMNMIVNGTYAKEDQADGSAVYTLTPDDGTDGATLTVSADGATAQYTAADGTVTEMVTTTAEAAAYKTFKGTQTSEALQMDVDVIMELAEDGQCTVTLDVMGNTAVIDQGTYTEDGDSYTFTLGNAKTAEYVDGGVHYAVDGTDIGDLDVTLELQ